MKTLFNKNTELFGKVEIYEANKDLWACLDNPTLKQLNRFISCVNENHKDYKSVIRGIKKNEFAELYVNVPLNKKTFDKAVKVMSSAG